MVRDEPLFEDAASGRISGVRMWLEPEPAGVSRTFDLGLFDPFFQNLVRELLDSKQLAPDDKVRRSVYAERCRDVGGRGDPVRVRRKSLPLVDGQLDAFLSKSQAVGQIRDDDYPVFLADSALERAMEIVWKRNEERGVWVIGRLFRQLEPVPEVFGVGDTVIEARGVKHSRFNLSLSPETFSHVDRQLAIRRRRFGETGEMPLGFYHSHPFLPAVLDGKESCPDCPLRSTCELTSSFFSKQDAHAFHIPYFGGAAYAIELVLGLTPREEFDLKMFCLDGGQFRERGYYRLAQLPAEARLPHPPRGAAVAEKLSGMTVSD
jgi:hypothetical protein